MTKTPFRPRARLLQLLGDQLIGSSKLAVFELVKNAYDADASKVSVTIKGIKSGDPYIVIRDNGVGMSADTIQNVWMVPGDDHREKQRKELRRTTKFKRLPLGEKGVGRFAVHKLGDEIKMITRASGHKEAIVSIDWPTQLENQFLDETDVKVSEREAKVFEGKKTGTAIRISKLREQNWTRGETRKLFRQIMSISSPFKKYDDNFVVTLKVPEFPEWVSEIPDAELISRTVTDPDNPKSRKKKLIADWVTIDGIGPVEGEFYVFDRDPEILSKYGDSRQLSNYLDQNGGIRVYRDGIRVYNYGELGDDWLGLDLRRVNSPVRKLSRNIVIGTIDLDLENSPVLKEKTNREGFVDNDAYDKLKSVILGALGQLEVERFKDKQRLKALTGKSTKAPKDLKTPISKLRRISKKHKISKETDPVINQIEKDYSNLRDNFLRAGLSQVGLALVFHEVERGLDVLYDSIEQKVTLSDLSKQASELRKILEISTQLLKKGEKDKHSLKLLVKRAKDLSRVRFRVHKIKLECPILNDDGADEEAVFAFGLVLGALTNILDNAVHWLKIGHATEKTSRRIYVDLIVDYPQGPAIIIADNGTGFLDNPEELIQPFFSRRPDGMGLGLHYSNMVMQINDGALVFVDDDDNDFFVPEEYNGAKVALVFKGT